MLKRFVVGLAGIVAAGMLYQLFGSYRDRRRFAAPGRLVDVGGTILHLNKQGTGQPVVVLEAGIAASSISWTLVQPELAKFTTVCSYDRAGLGWSGKQHSERTLRRMTEELSGLLAAAGLLGPFVLAGHSFGGLLIRAYALRYPKQVSGLVFVDPVSLALWSECSDWERKRLVMGARLSRRGAMLARMGVVRAALALLMSRGQSISRMIGRTAAGRGSAVLEKLVGEVRKLPREVWPAIRAQWSGSKSFGGMAAYLECLPTCARELGTNEMPKNIPVTILSAGTATSQELQERERMIAGNPRGQHAVLAGAGHWLHLEKPREVVNAVLTVINPNTAIPGNNTA